MNPWLLNMTPWLKAGILNGGTAVSIWDITTTKELLQTTNTVFFPSRHHCMRDRTAQYVLLFFFATNAPQLLQKM